MQLFSFEADHGEDIEAYGSVSARVNHVTSRTELFTACIRLRAGGRLGMHEAAMDQLFLVMAGEGEIRDAEDTVVPVRAGHAVWWQPGEMHETRSATGLSAMVLEGEGLRPGRGLVPLVPRG